MVDKIMLMETVLILYKKCDKLSTYLEAKLVLYQQTIKCIFTSKVIKIEHQQNTAPECKHFNVQNIKQWVRHTKWSKHISAVNSANTMYMYT